MNSTEIPMVNIPLASKAHQLARQFAAEQISADKSKQVYLNTLSVYAVSRYLKRLQVKTDLSQGDSWNAGMRLFFDVADLVLPGIGKLECRWVMPGDTACALPPDVPEDLIGYLVVKFSESLAQAQLLGFYPAVTGSNPPEQIKLKKLKSREFFIDHITKLEAARIRGKESVIAAKRINLTNANNPASRQPKAEENNLGQWLNKVFEQGWQTFEEVFSTSVLSQTYAMRENTTKDSIAIIVALTPITEQKVHVWIQLHSCGDNLLLPKDLQLMIIDQSGEVFEQKSMEQDGKLLKVGGFSAQKGERFTVKVIEGDNSFVEDFVLDFNSRRDKGIQVTLSQEEFDYQLGYRFTLEIKDAYGGAKSRIIQNWLPPAPELIQHCHYCRELSHELHRMQIRLRLEKPNDSEAENQISYDYEMLQQVREKHAQAIKQRNNNLNLWLNSDSFRNVKQAILDHSMEQDEIVVLIRTDSELQRLPWAAWDLNKRRPGLEFSRLSLERKINYSSSKQGYVSHIPHPELSHCEFWLFGDFGASDHKTDYGYLGIRDYQYQL